MNNKIDKIKTVRKKFQYNARHVDKAVELYQNKILSLRKAAAKYGVPYATVRDRCARKYDKKGKLTILSLQEEDELCGWILYISRCGFSLTKSQLQDSVQHYLVSKNEFKQLKDNRPGYKWCQCFMKRHPQISEALLKRPTKGTEHCIRDWFKKVNCE